MVEHCFGTAEIKVRFLLSEPTEKIKMRNILLSVTLVVLMFSPASGEEALRESQYRLIEAFNFIVKNHINEIDTEKLVNKLILKMTEDLDKNTRFLTPDASKSHLKRLEDKTNIYSELKMIEDVIYIRISSFGHGASIQLHRAFLKLVDKHGPPWRPWTAIKGIIIDLRFNSGGWIYEAVEIVDFWIDKGLIVEEHGRNNVVTYKKNAHRKMLIPKSVPMIILIDGESASASEIVAAALKDHKRATLLGSRTYGKGTVQSYQNFANGSTLWVTSEKYYTKSGNEIDGVGVEPNIHYEPNDAIIDFSGNDLQTKRAVELLMKQ